MLKRELINISGCGITVQFLTESEWEGKKFKEELFHTDSTNTVCINENVASMLSADAVNFGLLIEVGKAALDDTTYKNVVSFAKGTFSAVTNITDEDRLKRICEDIQPYLM